MGLADGDGAHFGAAGESEGGVGGVAQAGGDDEGDTFKSAYAAGLGWGEVAVGDEGSIEGHAHLTAVGVPGQE